MKKRLKILSIWVDPITEKESIEKIETILETGTKPHAIFASNPEKSFSVPKDPELYKAFKNADILLPDGIGMVIAAKLLYGIKVERVAGFETFLNICKIAAKKDKGVYLYGAKEEVSKKAADLLIKRYPGLKISGRSNGYVTENEMDDLVKKINESGADVLFMALGSPRQEKWFTKYKDSLKNIKICQGVGGSLDVIAGNVKRSPDIWIKYNVEWLYRLLAEPKRIKRQIVLPIFVMKIFFELINMKMGFSKKHNV